MVEYFKEVEDQAQTLSDLLKAFSGLSIFHESFRSSIKSYPQIVMDTIDKLTDAINGLLQASASNAGKAYIPCELTYRDIEYLIKSIAAIFDDEHAKISKSQNNSIYLYPQQFKKESFPSSQKVILILFIYLILIFNFLSLFLRINYYMIIVING